MLVRKRSRKAAMVRVVMSEAELRGVKLRRRFRLTGISMRVDRECSIPTICIFDHSERETEAVQRH